MSYSTEFPNYPLLVRYITERRRILSYKNAGASKPWTNDPILRTYRFCNAEREDDTVTKWIAKNWRSQYDFDPDLWLGMVVARLINWPDTLAQIGYPNLQSNDKEFQVWRGLFLDVMATRRSEGVKAYNSAYIVSTNGHKQDKAEYLAEHVLTPMWKQRQFIRPQGSDSLASFAYRLQGFDGMGGFMTGQVIADLKYAEGCVLRKASDWDTWALSGPGSRRGLNRLLGKPKDSPWKEAVWHERLLELQVELRKDKIALHAQDVQNNLCEFDKYLRVLHNEGRPRSLYPGV